MREPVLFRNFWRPKPNNPLVAVFRAPSDSMRLKRAFTLLDRVPAIATILTATSSNNFIRVLSIEVADDTTLASALWARWGCDAIGH